MFIYGSVGFGHEFKPILVVWGLCQSFEISRVIHRLKALVEEVQNPKWHDLKPTR